MKLKAGEKPAEKPGARTAVAAAGDRDPRTLLARTASLLERLVTAVETALTDGEGNSALVRESAGLVRAAASLSAEQRALEKHAEQSAERAVQLTVADMTDSLVIAYLLRLKPEGRRSLLLKLEEAAHGAPRRGVLG